MKDGSSVSPPPDAFGEKVKWPAGYEQDLRKVGSWSLDGLFGLTSIEAFSVCWDCSLAVPPQSGEMVTFHATLYGMDAEVIEVASMRQVNGIVFGDGSEALDWIPVRKRGKGRLRSIGSDPRWVDPTNANWPTCEGEPAVFVGDVDVPPDDDRLGGFRVYMFLGQKNGDRVVPKVLIEDTSQQTADEHYRLED